MNKRQKGNFGEDYICEYLKKHRYEVMCRNFCKKCGEIDIIAHNDRYIVFVEVKTRRLNSLVSGLEAVTKTKQRRIIATADQYLIENETELQPRYDIAEVIVSNENNPKVLNIEYFEDAFDTTGLYCAN